MDDHTKELGKKAETKVTEMISHAIIGLKWLAWANTVVLVIFLCIFVRTDTYRKNQNISTNKRITDNSTKLSESLTKIEDCATTSEKQRLAIAKGASEERDELEACLKIIQTHLDSIQAELEEDDQ